MFLILQRKADLHHSCVRARVRVRSKETKRDLSGTHQLLVCATYVNLFDEDSILKKNTEALLVTCKEVGLEVNAGKT